MSDITVWHEPTWDRYYLERGDVTEQVGTLTREYIEELTDENRKLRLLAKAMRTYQYMDTDADPLAAIQLSNAITVMYDELGIEPEYEPEYEVPDA